MRGMRLADNLAWGLMFIIPASFLGAVSAGYVVHKVSQEHFRKLVALFLFLAGVRFLINPFVNI